ncbi:hypothetical protein [Bosea sp. (in: a-proteobacteria)]|jgi:hypothetical protein|uniref:hypothetical protein n=1 Tax=Bosea sp. (in: a-proteobacteria) TaxID=1871050 RepID=UPI003F71F133
MRRLIVLAASLVPLLTFAADDASAQRRFGGHGVHAGGFHGGGLHRGAMRAGGFGFGNRGFVRPGFGGYRGGIRPGGFGYRAGFYGGGPRWGYGGNRWYRGAYYGRPGYWRRGYRDNWGWGAAGLIAGTAIAASAYPYYGSSYDYDDPYYRYDPAPYYGSPYYAAPVYSAPVSSGIGGYCQTPVRTCALITPTEVGIGCSCRVSGGRARGTVIGP